jgi:hypothetical protein
MALPIPIFGWIARALRMPNRIFPASADDRFPGHRLATWILVLRSELKCAQGALFIAALAAARFLPSLLWITPKTVAKERIP